MSRLIQRSDVVDFETYEDDRDATRACFAMTDHPGIFSRVCGALALVGANIVDARGQALHVFFKSTREIVVVAHGDIAFP